MSLLIFYSRY